MNTRNRLGADSERSSAAFTSLPGVGFLYVFCFSSHAHTPPLCHVHVTVRNKSLFV